MADNQTLQRTGRASRSSSLASASGARPAAERRSVMPLSRRSKIALCIAALFAVYVGGYLFVRSQHWLVHRSGFAYGNTDNHSIAIGDLGWGFNPEYRVAQVSYLVFAPLRWGETAFWYIRHPTGKPWPYSAGA